jgi:AraC-like DNA-binding protein
MNQFVLQQGTSNELAPFSYIIEFALKKNQTIQLRSLVTGQKENIRFYYILEGKFDWTINHQPHVLYPGDLVLVLPGQPFGSEQSILDIGTLCWLEIRADQFNTPARVKPDKWSGLSEIECRSIANILSLSQTPVLARCREAGDLLRQLERELFSQEIGYHTRTGQLIDELFILSARQLTRRYNAFRDFPQTFMQLEQALRGNLSHQWTVAEMAALMGLGTTAFTEKVKNFTGFSPLNYLINIRISEAIKLLKKPDINITDIALDTGFYSSQHFSTTFKKLTGYTPGQFRKTRTQ